MRTVCSSLKHLESEAAYKLQVSACREAGAKCDQSVGPASAILHFTTQTNRKIWLNQIRKIPLASPCFLFGFSLLLCLPSGKEPFLVHSVGSACMCAMSIGNHLTRWPTGSQLDIGQLARLFYTHIYTYIQSSIHLFVSRASLSLKH